MTYQPLILPHQAVKEIAYSLGYEYPQYFVRLFRQQTGQTPMQYRIAN